MKIYDSLRIGVLLLCCPVIALGQDIPSAGLSDEDAAALLQTTTRDADQHRQLRRLRGTWKLERTDAQVGGSGTITYRSIAMGKFTAEEIEFGGGNLGILVNAVYGYDPLRDVYTATWYTSFNTIAFEGTARPEPGLDGFKFQLEHPILQLRPEKSFFYRITMLDQSRMKLELLISSGQGDEEIGAAFLATRREATNTAED